VPPREVNPWSYRTQYGTSNARRNYVNSIDKTGGYIPNFPIMPIDDRMDSHESWPAMVGVIEMGQVFAVRIGPSSSDENGSNMRVMVEVLCECGFHWQRYAFYIEIVSSGAGRHEIVDFNEGLRGCNETSRYFEVRDMCCLEDVDV